MNLEFESYEKRPLGKGQTCALEFEFVSRSSKDLESAYDTALVIRVAGLRSWIIWSQSRMTNEYSPSWFRSLELILSFGSQFGLSRCASFHLSGSRGYNFDGGERNVRATGEEMKATCGTHKPAQPEGMSRVIQVDLHHRALLRMNVIKHPHCLPSRVS